MKITVFRKSGCPWAAAVMGFLDELGLPYTLRNMSTEPKYARHIQAKTGQCKSPTVQIDSKYLADTSVEQVAEVLEKKGIVI